MGPTPLRNFRIDDDVWLAALERAQHEGVNVSELIRGWLTDYAAGRERVGPGRPAGVTVSRAELTKLRDLVNRILS